MKARFTFLTLLLAAFFGVSDLYAQCVAPSNASVTTVTATCINNGSISITAVTGGSLDSAGINPLKEYALVSSSNPSQPLIGWQNDSTFSNIYPGSYTVAIRYNCGSSANGYSDSLVKTAIVPGNYQVMSLSFSNIVNSFCNNGKFNVIATNGYTGTSGSYTYQLVSAQNAVQPDPAAPGPVQTSNLFDSLAPATYYVRVFDDCGNFRTAQVTVPSSTAINPFRPPNCGLTPFAQNQYGCDSATYRYNVDLVNNVNNYSNISFPAKLIMVMPDGVRDTVAFSSPAAYQIPNYNISSYINSNQLGPFYQELVDACGNVFTSFKSTLDTTKSFNATSSSSIQCTGFSITPLYLNYCTSVCGVPLGNNIYRWGPRLAPNSNGNLTYTFEFSIDSGATWLAQGTPVLLSFNTAYRFYLRICNTVYQECTQRGPVAPFVFGPLAQEVNSFACNGNSGINMWNNTAALQPQQVHVTFTQVPAGQPALPLMDVTGAPVPGTAGSKLNYLVNLKPGKYVYTATDTVCGRTYTDSITLTQPHVYTVTAVPQQGCNQGNIQVNIANTSNATGFNYFIGSYFDHAYKIDLIDNNNITIQTQSVFNMGATHSVIFSNLPLGTYTVAVTHDTTFRKGTDLCPVVDTIILSAPSTVDVSSSLFLACGGTSGTISAIATGGVGPYTYELYNGSVLPANLLTTQTSPLFTGLNSGQTYSIRAIDNCGTGTSVSKSFSPYAVVVKQLGTACLNTDLTLYVDSIPGATYSWTKNGNPLATTSYSLFLPSLSAADYGTYAVTVSVTGCTNYTASRVIDANSCLVLPVTLTYFNAGLKGEDALLTWGTATETNCKGYEVEHSYDGVIFGQTGFVGTKATNGYSTGILDYSYEDRGLASGRHYYRLKVTDLDGSYQYTQAVLLRLDNKGPEISVHPNPARNLIYIEGLTAGMQVRMTDATGRQVASQTANSAQAQINMERFASGVYLLQVSNENGRVTQLKIVKR